ncbi:hypothetical protein CYMTET_56137 [Cymbomonas tetramitiformis]|uniref:Uncharacterized protein n=1 Tax=Cymbomonas tetramitiformis TaxID=36881 RepID=A0AAE0BCR0_9CHLO|nr:hypothetical protein CYMTET_56137 [Cymbomonas tetramitiformis]
MESKNEEHEKPKRSYVVEYMTAEQSAAIEAEQARQFQAAVAEWRQEKVEGRGEARVVKVGGDFEKPPANPEGYEFPTVDGKNAGNWSPDGRGVGTHCC